MFQSLEWRSIGPHRGGRVVAVAGHPLEQGAFYFGACAGGVWKTTSGGAQWENVSDGFFQTSAIGAIALAPSAPDVLYVGTGEATIRGNVSHGDGVYVSMDGGRSWRKSGLADSRHIGKIIVHPQRPEVAYVAALGHAWGPSAERGVYRTHDGGATWEQSLFKSARAGAIDIAMDPHHPETLYASIWQVQRYPHALVSGGEDSGLWKSVDGGQTWKDISRAPGLPTGLLGKIGVAASPARPGRVWAIIEAGGKDGADDGGVFRSDDWGATWERVNAERKPRGRPWYYMHLVADPQDAETVWNLNTDCWKSINGGATFTEVPTPHGDNHALWIDPHNSNRMIEGNDGGACVTYDGAYTWSSLLNQPTAQFYHVTTDDQNPYNVYGSQQDNWAMRVPSSAAEGAISWRNYTEPGGGESGYIAVSRKPPYTVFGGGIGTGSGHGRLLAWNPQTGQARNITVWPEVINANVGGVGANQFKYRFQWTFPVEVSRHDPDALYICSNVVHRSLDEGTSWETISPDLTRNDPDKLGPSGGPITHDNSGAEIYCTIFAFRESPHERGVFWAGSDDGLIHLSRDGGATWRNITPSALPEWALISVIEPSPHDPATAYVAATRYKHDDPAPYLYKTSDYGVTWTSISAGLPEEAITRVIREDPNQRGLLYVGTELGVYLSFDDGAHWQPFQCNLPVTPIYDLIVRGTDLLAATHGRSFWILDDLSPLYQMRDGQPQQALSLFTPRPTVRVRFESRMEGEESPAYTLYQMSGPVTVAYRLGKAADGTTRKKYLDAGANPPSGVIFHYALAEAAKGPVELSIHAADGATIRTFSSEGEQKPQLTARQGANRFVWNLRSTPVEPLIDDPKAKESETRKKLEGLAPRALPGEYEARLRLGETTVSQRFTILPDERLAVTPEALREQFALKLAIYERVREIHQMVNQLRRIHKQVVEWGERAKSHENWAQWRTMADALREKLKALEGQLVNLEEDKPKPGPTQLAERLTILSSMIDESDDAPTRGAQEVYALLSGQASERRADLDRLLSEDVAAFNTEARTAGVPAVVV
ncbi:MAG: glycosyl hydrolase [Chloroflexota bacterium]|nr:glycosyl hydrolase [Chloroflexota bacterium]